MRKQEDFEQQKRENLLEFQQTFRDYSRLGWFWAISFLFSISLGVLLGVNQVADGVVCYRANQFCSWLRIREPKKIL